MKKLIVKMSIFVCIFVGYMLLLYRSGRLLFKNTDKAKVHYTKATISTLHQAVNMFKLDTGRYPSVEKGLWELVKEPADVNGWYIGGYLEQTTVPKDAWKIDFVYIVPADPNIPFDIISYGADGKEGGTGFDADIHSRDLDGSYK